LHDIFSVVIQTTDDGAAASARRFLGSVADLVTVKGLALLFFLSVITGVSVVAGTVVEGFYPGLSLTVLLVGSVVVEKLHYDRFDAVGVVAVGLAAAYTGLEFVGVLQELWFPVASAVLLLSTAAYDAWNQGFADAAQFVENLDVVGLHGGILFLLYAILLAGAPLDFIYAPVFPAVLLFFALSLLLTTIAYAARSPSVTSEELHHRLVSVVNGLEDVRNTENREKLAQHVRAVAQALQGVHVPTRVTVEGGSVPVVLPDAGQPVYEADSYDAVTDFVRDSRLTGYAVSDGDVLLVKNGEPTFYYLSDKNRFGHADALSGEGFDNASVYSAAYAFVDSVESVLPLPGGDVSGDDWAENAVENVEEAKETDDIGTLLGEGGDVGALLGEGMQGAESSGAESRNEAGERTEEDAEPDQSDTDESVPTDNNSDESRSEEAEPGEETEKPNRRTTNLRTRRESTR